MIEGLAELLDLTEAGLAALVLVFVRVGAVMALLPGFGEAMIPARVKLGLAVAFTLVVTPMVAPDALSVDPARPFYLLMLIEAAAGLLIGIAIRLLVLALQLAARSRRNRRRWRRSSARAPRRTRCPRSAAS